MRGAWLSACLSRLCWCALIFLLLAALAIYLITPRRLLREAIVFYIKLFIVKFLVRDVTVRDAELGVRRGKVFLTVHDVRVGNAPGDWTSPHALTIRRAHIQVHGFWGVASLIGLHRGLFLSVEPMIGFRVREIEIVEFEGVDVRIEDSSHEIPGAAQALLRGLLSKRPRNRGIGLVKRRECELHHDRLHAVRSVN